jgi:outer membrane receptor protein involved in Fe transport
MAGYHQPSCRWRWRLLAATSLGALLLPAASFAQPPPPQTPQGQAQTAPPASPPTKPGTALSGVTVKAAPEAQVRTSIDRRSYSVATDLRTAGGSVADALRNIPGAEVDVNGNLSYRGGSVQIMVDGQPSQLFNGPQGAQVLQGMPADRIDRVEVITNPTAAFSPEGGAGIINLVTKKSAPAGQSGGMRANFGSSGHANAAGNLAYTSGKLTAIADGGWRQDPQKLQIDTTGTLLDPLSGQTDTRAQHEVSTAPLEQWNGHLGVQYQIAPKTQLSLDGRYNGVSLSRNDDYAFLTAGPNGAPLNAYTRIGGNTQAQSVGMGQLMLRHQFAGQGQNDIVAFFNHTQTDAAVGSPSTDFITAPALATTYQDQLTHVRVDVNQFKADYTRTAKDLAQLKVGYDLRTIDSVFDNYGFGGTSVADAAPDPLFANLFHYRQMVNAAYATYEQPLGAFTVLGGLRLEDEHLDLDQITQALTVRHDRFNAFPTLHLAYRQSPTTQWTLSYSERIQRPGPGQLNPFRNVADPFNISEGNPDLVNQVTHSFEGAWNFRQGPKSYIATLFYRQMDKGVTNIITNLGGGALLTQQENEASGKTAGLELIAAAPLTKTVTYNVSTDLYWNQITGPASGLLQTLAFDQTKQGFNASGRGNINWDVTKNDLFQASAQINAGRITPQGHVDPLYVMYFGYRHKFTNPFSMVVQAQDPFDLVRQYTYVDTPGLNQSTVIKAHVQSFLLGFTYTFGGNGRPQRDPGFDFNAAPAALP